MNQTSKYKDLLIFAHRGEAQSFIEGLYLQSVPSNLLNLYENDHCFLLITGEGPFEVFKKLPIVLASYQISKIINLGIAAGLSPNCKIDHIYPIRTSYAEIFKEIEFKSYTLKSEETAIDCITSSKRIMTNDQASMLESFAPIVDRELWAISNISHFNKIPCEAYKLISDLPSKENSVCHSIKEKAEAYSFKLFNYYKKRLDNKKSVENDTNQYNILNDDFFYFSTSQIKKYNSLISSLEKKNNQTEKEIIVPIKKILKEKNIERAKKRATELIKKLQENLNPIETKIRLSLTNSVKNLQVKGIQVSFDPTYETDQVSLSFSIKDEQDLYQKIEELQNFPYTSIKSILRGQDV